MAVPRFDGTGCWQQHLQIVQAIVKENGWSEGTAAAAALQLFAHLDGGGPECGFTDAKGRKGEMGGPSCGPAAIRERDSPAGNGSSYVRH